MAIEIYTGTTTLPRSRFTISPAVELVATLKARQGPAQAHVKRAYAEALARLDVQTIDVLHALVPIDHSYTPDFLTPHPDRARPTRDDMVEAIASTSAEAVERQLDFLFVGRPPAPLQELMDAGPSAVAQEAAEAMGRLFDVALADCWDQTRAVLDADIAFRAETMAGKGLAGMLATLDEGITWDGHILSLPRPFDAVVDWADDGLLFLPCAAHSGPILCTAERPQAPTLTYPARGTVVLWSGPAGCEHQGGLAGLIGSTRLTLLQMLDNARTTTDLSLLEGHATATVSYHLRALHNAGLVTSRRSGRGVVYRRTNLGEALLVGALPRQTIERYPDVGPPARCS